MSPVPSPRVLVSVHTPAMAIVFMCINIYQALRIFDIISAMGTHRIPNGNIRYVNKINRKRWPEDDVDDDSGRTKIASNK